MKRTLLHFLATAILLCVNQHAKAQQAFTLSQIIEIARNQSIQAKQAETTRENRYWQYQTYRSNYKPQLGLEGVFPGFNRSFDEVRQNDGTYEFLPVSFNNSELNLSLRQSIGRTGTMVFVNTGINRFDNFSEGDEYHLYGGTPLEVGFVQPLFQFNDLWWDKKIEPLRFEESKREYMESLEEVSLTATRRFFDLMVAQIDLEIALKNLANNDTIYKIAQGRYNLGTLTENELLSLELNTMNSRQAVAQANLDLETSALRLRTTIGLTDVDELQLILPSKIPDFTVDEHLALEYARKNRAQIIEFERRSLQAESEIARAKGESGLNADLFGRFGWTNNTDQNAPVGDLYKNPENQLIVNMGFSIPILDWGRRRSRIKTAEANQKLVQYSVNQDILNFDEQVLTQVRQFEMLKEAVKITQLADNIANRRYEVSYNRYLIGKIAITELNDALREKDDAKRRYTQALEDFWNAYYSLRLYTLYDFEEQRSLGITE
jgi:outer membrane protein TolC